MAFYLNRLSALQVSVLEVFQASEHQQSWSAESLNGLRAVLDRQGQGSTDLVADLEIVFKILLSQLSSGLEAEVNVEQAAAIRFIKFTIDFTLAHHDIGDNFPKIPFLLIEDIMEYQTIHQAKRIWTVVESLVDKITVPVLFNKGKLAVLKTSNAILRKLSKSCDTEFCGRILMFLAAVYPLTELSALNLSGKINVTNQTYYDEVDRFQEHMNSVAAIDIVDEHMTTTDQHPMEVATPKGSSSVSTPKASTALQKANGGFQVTYDLYESFWKLQSFFSSSAKPFEPITAWNEFMGLAKKTVDIFEQSASIDASAPLKAHKPGSSSHNGDEQYQGNKYLTSSQLFALQLNDPLLRQQLSVQLWIFAHYLHVKVLPTVTDNKGKEQFPKDIAYLRDEAKKIIKNTASDNSEQLLDMVEQILKREETWITWKGRNCPTFIRSQVAVGEKRKFDEVEEGGISMDAVDVEVIPQDAGNVPEVVDVVELMRKKRDRFDFDYSDSNVKEISKFLADSCPVLDNLVEEYLEAEDPDAGIEEEYHPKNDHLYSWRTRRLLAERNLSVFAVMHDGDLGRGIRKLRGLPEPEPKVVVIEEEESMGAETGSKQAVEERIVVDLTLPPKREVIDIDVLMAEEERRLDGGSVSTPGANSVGKASPRGEPEDGEEVEIIE